MPPRSRKDPNRLFLKEQRFVEELPTAPTLADAVLNAGYQTTRQNAHVIANENLQRPAVARAVAKLNAKAESNAIATLAERKERLSGFLRAAKADRVAVREAIAASDQLNRIEQVYVEKSQVDQRIEIVVHGWFGNAIATPDTQPALPDAQEPGEPVS